MRDDGYVNIVGRIKDMVIRGGENIYPREIEEFLYTHPKDRRRAGHWRARRQIRRRSLCLDQLKDGSEATAEEIREFCRGQIATYKYPTLRPLRHGIPDDGHRKDPEIRMREVSIAELGLHD